MGFTVNGAEAMRIDQQGNVLIGTTTNLTGSVLTVRSFGSNSAALAIGDTNTAASSTGLYFYTTSTANIAVGTGGALVFTRNGGTAESMRINSNGNLGIGTITIGTGNTVAVFGGNLYVGSTNSGIRFSDGTYQSTAYTGAVAATGTLIRAPQLLTSGTSYTTPANCTKILVQIWGGGGGGGYGSSPARGGGAAMVQKFFTVTVNTTYAYSIGGGGSGGTAGSGGNGGNGSSTTFGPISSVTITAVGGGGAQGNTAGTGGQPDSTSNGDFYYFGYSGASPFNGASGQGNLLNGQGGNAGGGSGSSNGSPGTNGSVYIWEYT